MLSNSVACPSALIPADNAPQRISFAQRLEADCEAGTLIPLAGDGILIEMPRIDVSGEDGIALQVGHLAAVRLAHPHIPDQHAFPHSLTHQPFSPRHLYSRLSDNHHRVGHPGRISSRNLSHFLCDVKPRDERLSD